MIGYPNLGQIATETFLVPTAADWVDYENFPEKSPKFFADGKPVFRALLKEAFFKTFFQERFTCPPPPPPPSQSQKGFNLRDFIILTFCNFT